ncbi:MULTISPECIES: hypothetical protein [Deinococcus]|uniref:hypothetical protein n=1 Tax=Deinococcus TaxID=1298 RepID=UPI000ADE2099|nr:MULTISPECIES: hypothetical protein [Deinococcus]
MTKQEGHDKPQEQEQEHLPLSESAQDKPPSAPQDEASTPGKHGRPTDDSDPGHS